VAGSLALRLDLLPRLGERIVEPDPEPLGLTVRGLSSCLRSTSSASCSDFVSDAARFLPVVFFVSWAMVRLASATGTSGFLQATPCSALAVTCGTYARPIASSSCFFFFASASLRSKLLGLLGLGG